MSPIWTIARSTVYSLVAKCWDEKHVFCKHPIVIGALCFGRNHFHWGLAPIHYTVYIYICIYMLYNAYLGESKTCDLNKKITKDLSGILHSRLICSGCFQTNWWNYFADSPCMDYLPTGKVKREKWLHSRRNVGKYSHPMEHLGWVGNMTVVNFCFAIANRRFRESIECHSKGTRWFF